jgi:citronellol/citronellal dehydrogenase
MSLKPKNVSYVLKSFQKYHCLVPSVLDLTGRTYIVSGSTRGIGYDIAEKLLKQNANVTILGKTRDPHPKLEGTLDTAVNKLQEISDNVHGEICDVRNEENIEKVIKNTNDKFGGIDGIILNASALCLNNTIRQTSKEINLMTDVNIKGSFLMGKYALPYIQNSYQPHILTISPPIDMLYNDEWWKNHLYYSMSKFNMSLMAKFWNSEFTHIGVNTLWPRTTINTAPVRNILGGEEMINISRKTDIMGDAATAIMMSDPLKCKGNNFIDDEVIISIGKDVEQYRVNPNIQEKDLMPDFFC